MENASKALIIAGAILISILLITIGIVLINSGRDITETGTAGMASQKIQTFNAQFTTYEGTKKGSELRSLFNTARASNASDEVHQVAITGDVANAGALVATRDYTVTIEYSGGDQYALGAADHLSGAAAGADISSEAGYIAEINIDAP